MELIQGTQLIKKNKTHTDADEVLVEAELIAFYFSGHWCGPCRGFTPILADAYKTMKEAGSKIEVIFVSSDSDIDAMFSYMNESHGDWLAVPFGSDIIRELKKKYSVRGIPTLVVIKKDGTLIREDGCEDIYTFGPDAFKRWIN